MHTPPTYDVLRNTAANRIAREGEGRAMIFFISSTMAFLHGYAARQRQPIDAVIGRAFDEPGTTWQTTAAVIRRCHELREPIWMDAADVPLPDVCAVLMTVANRLTFAMSGELFWEVPAR